jgi:hypothetical protein
MSHGAQEGEALGSAEALAPAGHRYRRLFRSLANRPHPEALQGISYCRRRRSQARPIQHAKERFCGDLRCSKAAGLRKDRYREREQWRTSVLSGIAVGLFPPSTMAVAFYISSKLNSESEIAWPSQETIAAAVGLKPATVKEYVGLLKDRGYLIVDRANRQKSNRYKLASPQRSPKQMADVLRAEIPAVARAEIPAVARAEIPAVARAEIPALIPSKDHIDSSLSGSAVPAGASTRDDGCKRLAEKEATSASDPHLRQTIREGLRLAAAELGNAPDPAKQSKLRPPARARPSDG